MKTSILTVGSLAFDSIQTPSGKVDKILGGAANHFSIASSFFTPTEIIGVVGSDFPKAHLDRLASRNIGISGIEIAQGQTFHWVGSYTSDFNEAQTLSTFLNVFERFDPKLSTEQRACKYVFLCNIDPALQLSVLNQVENPQLVGCDSMNFWITGKPADLKSVLKRIDLLSINEGEARLLSGTKNIHAAAEIIMDMGPKVLAIKRGEYGSALFTQNGIYLSPAYPVRQVVDPTGAGDSFAGAMMGFLASKKVTRQDLAKSDAPLRRAVLMGSVMASFNVEDFGFSRLLSLTHEELSAREKKFQEMITI